MAQSLGQGVVSGVGVKAVVVAGFVECPDHGHVAAMHALAQGVQGRDAQTAKLLDDGLFGARQVRSHSVIVSD
jgi:hypothetical protein